MEAQMIRHTTMAALLMLGPVSLASTAHGQQLAPTADLAKKPTADQNERVCKDIATSSRLATRRYCATRAEWQAFEQGERQEIQLMQRPMQGCANMGGRKC
jgi:ABC-type taurine transport system substrate-binding protein